MPKKAENGNYTRPEISSEYVLGLIEEYKANVLSKRKYRNDVVVRYYRHEKDGDKATFLVEYGFYLHERPIKNQKRYKEKTTNVIYFGHEFPESDLKFITTMLLENGMKIKRLEPFKDYDGWKRKAIEIGYSTRFEKLDVMSVEDVRDFSMPE